MDYVEGHGTGTKLGDPLEVAALTEVLGQVGSRSRWSRILVLNVLNHPSLQLQEGRILLGSVKGNVGHLNTAAGESRVVGILKKIFQNVRRQVEVVQPCIVPLKAELELVIVSGVPGLMKSETESDLDIGYIG